MEKNGKKLYQNAVDLEFADRGMREFGVREALGRIGGDPQGGPLPGLVAGPETAALPPPRGLPPMGKSGENKKAGEEGDGKSGGKSG